MTDIKITYDSRSEQKPTVSITDIAPVVPPPPPPVTTDVVLTGTAVAHRQWSWLPDRAKRADIDAAIAATPPWTWFDNAQQEFSPSLKGAPNTKGWVRLPVWGNFGGLYKGMPRLMPDGTVLNANSKAPGDDIELNIVPWVKTQGLRPGKRGEAITTPYTAWRGHSRRLPDGTLSMHPDVPYIVGVDVLGNIWYRMRDGSVRLPFTIPGAKEVHDWCPSPASRKTMYVCDTGNNRVLEILRGTTDFTVVAQFPIPRPTSVIALPDDSLFAVSNNAVWNPWTNTKVADIFNAFYLDYDSRGHLIVGCLNLAVYDVDPATGTATMIRPPGTQLQTWVTVSVDREGTCGEKDNILLCHMHSGGNNTIQVRKAGVWMDGYKFLPIGIGQTTIGSINYAVDIFGHYPWTAIYSPDSAEIYLEGVSDINGSVIAARTPNMPWEDPYDHNAFTAGRAIIQYGCGPGTPYGSVPSFTCQMSDQGWSGIGVTADYIAEMPLIAQERFVQQGMLGSVPRNIKGRDLYNVLYFIGRSSQRGFREGKPYFDALKAYCSPMFGRELPAIPQTLIDDNTAYFMDASIVGGKVKVAFVDLWSNPKTPEAGVVINVSIDEGQSVPDGAAVTLAPGQHSLRPVSFRTALRQYAGRASVVVV